jgi:histidyl-tRNA synthetase
MSTVKAVRGTRDLLPPETELWNRVEATARAVFDRYGFGEIRTPIFEETALFARGVGEETDIVSKEMYTWEDGGRADLTFLHRSWREKHQIPESSNSITIETKLKPAMFTGHVMDGLETFIEFQVILKPRPDLDIRDRAKELRERNVHYLLVMPAWRYSLIDVQAYEQLGIQLETISGRFITSQESLTLRPENTAGVVRAYIEHKLGDTGHLQKLFYIGPQFRRERPQRGRYRQFWQIGAEVLGPPSSGSESPIRDAEVLELLASLLDELGIKNWRLELNSVGSSTDRPRYLAALREALAPIKHLMCEDNQRRAENNPLRVLDSKDPNDQELINALPKIADFLDADSTAHFQQVLAGLDACGVAYTVNPRLVRGLDYYTRTTFEFTVPDGSGLGTQNALLGGGRYDGLSEMLGGPRAPGIGFAIGEDRLILSLQAQAAEIAPTKLDAYIAPLGVERNPAALALARELRRAGLSVEVGDGSFKLKKNFEAADRVARHIVLLGEDEVATGILTVKTFATGKQVKVERKGLTEHLRAG